MDKDIRAFLSKINFRLGRNPKVEKNNIYFRKFIPKPYIAVVIISADFELAWAWRYAKAFKNSKQEAMKQARIARDNIPRILKLCDKYDIPITWATAGHLFLGKCSKDGELAHPNMPRIPFHENEFWRFIKGDWFQHDPCSNYIDAPEWYAPDLIKKIQDAKAKHEIACHTFSHIDCRDGICPPEVFESEIKECKKAAQQFGIKLESFVHPGHTIGNLTSLWELGFTSFRTDYDNVLGYPVEHDNGLWELKSTAELTLRRGWSVDYHIYRYKKIIDRAVKNNSVCYFWLHCSMSPVFIERIMPHFFEYIDDRKDVLWVVTTKEYVNWVGNREHDKKS